ncbi:MAG: alanyl-tRNA synthetase [Nitrospiraceae bacterium]
MKTIALSGHAQDRQAWLRWKRAGLLGLMFFMVKGLLWLIAIMLYLIG